MAFGLFLLCMVGAALAEEGFYNSYPEDWRTPSQIVGMQIGKYPIDGTAERADDPDYNPDAPQERNLEPQECPFRINGYIPTVLFKPGDVVYKPFYNDVECALSDVLRADEYKPKRAIAVGVERVGGTDLTNPQKWLYSGQIEGDMPSSVGGVYDHEAGLLLFTKIRKQRGGTAGVLSYDISGSDFKVAILWVLPLDFDTYDAWFNVKVLPKSMATDESMYQQLYYYKGAWRAAGRESRVERGVNVTAIMTGSRQSVLRVIVDSSALDPSGATDIFSDCSESKAIGGTYCWNECPAGGYCWMDSHPYQCLGGDDCRGNMYRDCNTPCTPGI